MRIDRTDNNQVQSTETSGTHKTGKANHAHAAKKNAEANKTHHAHASEAAKTEISTAGKDFAKARGVAANAPDVREEKIAELKRRIAEGKYEVDNEALADRMVDEHLSSGIG